MPAPYSFVGMKFGQLTVVSRAPNSPHGQTRWNCRCDCGTEKSVLGYALKQRTTKSCGCTHPSLSHEPRYIKHGHSNRQHRNKKPTTEYSSWAAMIGRCNCKPSSKMFKRYGARGVHMCERWKTFENFLQDMGPAPTPKHSIDRWPDNDGNYEPGNCRWATSSQQNRNRSSNCRLTIDGVTKVLIAWSEESGVKRTTIKERLRSGWSHKDAVFTPTRLKS